MLVSYERKGKQIKFIDTYSNYNSAINGFGKLCNRLGKERGMDPMQIAGETVFISIIKFVCTYGNKQKICNSIKELEKWLMNYTSKLDEVSVVACGNDIKEMKLNVTDASKPYFYGMAKTDSQFLKDLFDMKTKNWKVDIA